MSDWQIGDLAVCIRGGGPELTGHGLENGADYELQEGRVYRVRWVGLGSWSGVLGLKFEGLFWGWRSDRFRKIRPDEHEGNAEDWQLLRETHKRKVSA